MGHYTCEVYTERQAMWESLLQHGLTGDWIFSHNLEYDLPIVAGEHLYRGDLTFTPGHMLWAAYRRGKRKARFYDSANLFPRCSVADLGEWIGLPKLELPPDIKAKIRSRCGWASLSAAERSKVRGYVIRDAKIVLEAVSALQETALQLGGELKSTIAGVSMSVFRHRYMKWPWRVVPPRVNQLARPAFYGGRVESYMMGEVEGVNYYDLNSAYPAVQREASFPHPSYLAVESGRSALQALEKWEGIGRAMVQVPEMWVPPLPHRSQFKLFFPFGEMNGTWTLLELREALRRGVKLKKLYWVLGSKVTFNPFTEFIEDIYRKRVSLRKAGDMKYVFLKLILDSLYGRFGLNPKRGLWRMSPMPDDPDWYQLHGHIPREVNGRAVTYGPIRNLPQPAYANVLFAAQVSSANRVRMLQTMTGQGENLVYCDTDSVMTLGRLEVSGGLGGWSNKMLDGRVDLLGLKEYVLHNTVNGDEYVAKGVPERAMEEYLRTGAARYERALKIREAIASGKKPSEWVEVVRTRRPTVPKRFPADLSGSGSGGFVLTVPWRVDQLDRWTASPPDWSWLERRDPSSGYFPEWVRALARDLGVAPWSLRKSRGTSA